MVIQGLLGSQTIVAGCVLVRFGEVPRLGVPTDFRMSLLLVFKCVDWLEGVW